MVKGKAVQIGQLINLLTHLVPIIITIAFSNCNMI